MINTITYPKEVKAIKEHSCNFCLDKIRVGETYIKSTHVFDGQLYDWKAHKNCAYIADKLKMYDDCENGVNDEDFSESISEEHYCLLTNRFANDEKQKYRDILQQLRCVSFKEKLGYVIRYYKKLDKEVQS